MITDERLTHIIKVARTAQRLAERLRPNDKEFHEDMFLLGFVQKCNNRTFCNSAKIKQKGTPSSAFLKMVPLVESARVSQKAASKKVPRRWLVTPPPLHTMRAMKSVPDLRIASRSFVSPILLHNIIKTPKPPFRGPWCFNGAASKNRTYDPVITNDVLYH